jgi:MerR family transcriptional regulator, light-induced transcriptional regulator
MFAASPEQTPLVRIGELSRRTGVTPDTLRAWERRYRLLQPSRSDGGFRLYGPADERRVHSMKAMIDSGASASEAARLAIAGEGLAGSRGTPGGTAAEMADRLGAALERFDEPAANDVLDSALTTLTVEAVINQVVLPVTRAIGQRWEAGAISVAQEHFATGVLRARMLALARNWGAGAGPVAILACPPGELHDLGLVAFGVVLRDRGWKIYYLGPDTPIAEVARAASELRPAAVVLAALSRDPLERDAAEIQALASGCRVLLAGQGADDELAARLGAEAMTADPVAAALRLGG